MFQKDYIMRMIEQLANVLAKVMGFKVSNRIEEIHPVLNEALYDFTGLGEAAIEGLSYKDLIDLVSGFDQINPAKCYILAELLKAKADAFASSSELNKSFNLYLKSFNIYAEVLLSNNKSDFEPNYNTIDETISIIRQFQLPYETQKLRFRYYERVMNYDKAEDVLFELLDQGAYQKIMLSEGIAFYERLKKVKPEDLEKGNLPLEEVVEGLEKVKGFTLAGND